MDTLITVIYWIIIFDDRYAREDTHYLLYIYDLMRIELFSMLNEPESVDAPLVEVIIYFSLLFCLSTKLI